MRHRIRLIANPTAGRGRAARALPLARAAFRAAGADERLTTRAGDEARLVREALDDGIDTLAVLGGDGTWSKAAAALATAGADCRLLTLAAGTGNDFAKTLGVPARDYAAMARLAVDGADRRIDLGSVAGRLFLNVAGFGFTAAVIADTERIRWLRGDALYFHAALRQLFRYRGMTWCDDAGKEHALVLAFANGHTFGGSFRIAPGADPADGLLDEIRIADASATRRARLFAAATSGRHVALPEVRERRGGRFMLRFAEPPAYEADGELLRAPARDVEVACVPGAVRVVVG